MREPEPPRPALCVFRAYAPPIATSGNPLMTCQTTSSIRLTSWAMTRDAQRRRFQRRVERAECQLIHLIILS